MRSVKAVSSYFFLLLHWTPKSSWPNYTFKRDSFARSRLQPWATTQHSALSKVLLRWIDIFFDQAAVFFDNLPKHNTVRLLCSYNGIARLSLPLMLAWRQTLPKVLHRWNYIVLTFAAVSFDHHLKHAIYTSLFQPLSSNQRPQQSAPSMNARKRKSDNEVGTICGTQTMFSCDIFICCHVKKTVAGCYFCIQILPEIAVFQCLVGMFEKRLQRGINFLDRKN